MEDDSPSGSFLSRLFGRRAKSENIVIDVESGDTVEIVADVDGVEKKVIVNQKTKTGVVEGIIFFLDREKDKKRFYQRVLNVLSKSSKVIVRVGKKGKFITRPEGVVNVLNVIV